MRRIQRELRVKISVKRTSLWRDKVKAWWDRIRKVFHYKLPCNQQIEECWIRANELNPFFNRFDSR